MFWAQIDVIWLPFFQQMHHTKGIVEGLVIKWNFFLMFIAGEDQVENQTHGSHDFNQEETCK